jgi:hypothetical protein
MRTEYDVMMFHPQSMASFELVETITRKWTEKISISTLDTIEITHIAFDKALLDLGCPPGEQIFSNILSAPFKLSEAPPYPHTSEIFAVTC